MWLASFNCLVWITWDIGGISPYRSSFLICLVHSHWKLFIAYVYRSCQGIFLVLVNDQVAQPYRKIVSTAAMKIWSSTSLAGPLSAVFSSLFSTCHACTFLFWTSLPSPVQEPRYPKSCSLDSIDTCSTRLTDFLTSNRIENVFRSTSWILMARTDAIKIARQLMLIKADLCFHM